MGLGLIEEVVQSRLRSLVSQANSERVLQMMVMMMMTTVITMKIRTAMTMVMAMTKMMTMTILKPITMMMIKTVLCQMIFTAKNVAPNSFLIGEMRSFYKFQPLSSIQKFGFYSHYEKVFSVRAM